MADLMSFASMLGGAGISLLNTIGSSSPTVGPTLVAFTLTLVAMLPNYIVFTVYNWPIDLLSPSNPNNPCGSTNPALYTFDYIIVGAGAAGSVMANRLSQNPSLRILLIEAGDTQTPVSIPPALFPSAVNATPAFWPYRGVVNNGSCNCWKNGAVFNVGKMLGGSTGNNAMVYACATDQDYNNMANIIGDPNFSYFNLLPYRMRAEGNTDTTKNPLFHNFTGPLIVSNSTFVSPLNDAITAGWQQLNYQYSTDYNTNASYNGIFDMQFTVGKGERCSSARAYLLQSQQYQRPNLFIMRNSIVTKVNFNLFKVATSVQVSTPYSSCLNITMIAKKEIILSAGALNTPKILLQSGVGKAADLAPFGIPQVADLPVGNDLQDHVFGINFIAVNMTSAPISTFDSIIDAMNYLLFRTGSLSNLGVLRRQAFINLNSTTARYPDFQFKHFFFPRQFPLVQKLLTDLGLKDEVISKVVQYNQNNDILMIFNILLNPLSTGTVKLSSANPLAPPTITTGYFTDPGNVDLNKQIQAYQTIQKFLATPVMSQFSPEFITFNEFTNCLSSGPFNSSAFWNCHRTFFTGTLWHPVATAKLGSLQDSNGVLDPNFKVKGFISNLRVVDASVFPKIPSSNTQCPTYTIAEYAAARIQSGN